MHRYFFNIYDGVDIFDKEGTLLAGKREMRMHMIATASALFDDQSKFKDGMWRMEALDEDGKIVGTMDFGLEPNEQ